MSPSATPAPQSEGRCLQAPPVPGKVKVYVAKWGGATTSATRATPTAAVTTASNGNRARHQSQPSVITALLSMPSEGQRRQVVRGRTSCVCVCVCVCALTSCVCGQVVCEQVVCEEAVCGQMIRGQSCVLASCLWG